MYAPTEDKHRPDPKCCGRGLKPRCLANDLLRLIVIVLLLLPFLLLLMACEKRRGFPPPVTSAARSAEHGGFDDAATMNPVPIRALDAGPKRRLAARDLYC